MGLGDRAYDEVAVDPDSAGAKALGGGEGAAHVTGADTSGQAVGGVVGALEHLVRVRELGDVLRAGPMHSQS